jgi:outer membrane protein
LTRAGIGVLDAAHAPSQRVDITPLFHQEFFIMTFTRSLASLGALALAAATVATPVQAKDDGDWIVRARAVNLDSANKDGTGLGLTINDKVIPEIDISYFLSPNLALELILTVPQKQTVHSSVLAANAGTFKHLPPTLTVQYHFTQFNAFRPYVGAGLNYTRISSVDLGTASTALGGNVDLKRNSYGLALQLGVDVPLANGWLLNLDVKKVQIGTTVLLNGASAGDFDVDPVLVGIGIGKRF